MNNDPGKIHHAEKELSQLYQSLPAPEPDETTDEAILHFAKQRTLVKQVPVRKIKVNWTGGFSLAASVLAVSVLYWTQFAPSQDPTSPGAPMAEMSLPMDKMESPQLASRSQSVSNDNADTSSASLVQSPAAPAQIAARQQRSALTTSHTAAGASVIATEQVGVSVVATEQASAPEAASHISPKTPASELVASVSKKLRQGVTLIPQCQVSVGSGYRLSNTPLASFTEKWSSEDKVWLTEQLNVFKPLTFILDEYQGNDVAMFQVPGFDTAYQQTLQSLKNCKQQPPVPVEQ